MSKTDEDLQHLAERSRRVRMSRDMLNLSRPEIKKKYGIAISTMQFWENPKGSIAESSARKLIEIYRSEGLDISLEWLMYGIGEAPVLVGQRVFKAAPMDTGQLTIEEIIARELKVFYQLNENACHAVVNDDGFLPYILPGDYVAGKRYFSDEISQAEGMPSIVQTETGLLLIRVVIRGEQPSYFHLHCANSKATAVNATMRNVKLFWAAPIVWIRKLNLTKQF